MHAQAWSRRLIVSAAVSAAATTTGCKTLSERYIALEVWKYEKCFGHLPPGFVPPGAAAQAAAPGRICGQNAGCPNACPPATAGCDSCGGGTVVEGGRPLPATMGAPGGPGGSPAASAPLPTPAGVTTGKPVIISDEVVMPAG